MSITTLNFLLFFVIVLILYYAVPKRFQWILLLVASYTFFLYGGIKPVFFILATTVITYCGGLIMQKRRNEYKNVLAEKKAELTRDEKQQLKKDYNKKIHRIQVLAVLLDLGILVYVKYANFLLEMFNGLLSSFGSEASIPYLNVIVPLGISFYTFESMGYLIDIGRGKYDAERHFGKFAAFISYFPSLVQGPISRFDDLGKQIQAQHKLEYKNITYGAQLMMFGFFKKFVIADRLSPMVTQIFSNYESYDAPIYILGLLGYTFQMYGDFSGGIDIVRGASEMLGINLPLNFERPFFSQSVAEFWRRWHITLGGWMRDYVFYPVMLSKPITKISRKARAKNWDYCARVIPSALTAFVVFFLIGIWHGASVRFLLFGLYNAVIVAGGVALEPVFEKMKTGLKVKTDVFSWKFFCALRTFLVMGPSRFFARAVSATAGLTMIGGVFTKWSSSSVNRLFGLGTSVDVGISNTDLVVAVLGLCVVLVISILQEKGTKIRETLAAQNIIYRWLLLFLLLFVILVFGVYGPSYSAADFIYQAY